MLYTILCYNSEKMVTSWTKEEDDAVMEKLIAVGQARPPACWVGRAPRSDDDRTDGPEG
jgi:hypothetical protein